MNYLKCGKDLAMCRMAMMEELEAVQMKDNHPVSIVISDGSGNTIVAEWVESSLSNSLASDSHVQTTKLTAIAGQAIHT